MILTELKIELSRWGEDKGKHVGKASFAGEAAPQVERLFSLVARGKHNGLILAALRVINPPCPGRLQDRLPRVVGAHSHLHVAVAVPEVFK